MKKRHVKFEEKIRTNIVDDANRKEYAPTHGIVLRYNPETNRADIVTAKPGSEQLGEIYKDVPCPQMNGVQSVAPEAGRPVWIGFPSGTQNKPVITSYYNPSYHDNDHAKQYDARSDIPRFMMDL